MQSRRDAEYSTPSHGHTRASCHSHLPTPPHLQVPEMYVGAVVELFAQRKGEMVDMQPSLEVRAGVGGFVSVEFTRVGCSPSSTTNRVSTHAVSFCFKHPPQATTRVSFKIATRGLLGLKNALLTATRGMGLLNTIFDEVGASTALGT